MKMKRTISVVLCLLLLVGLLPPTVQAAATHTVSVYSSDPNMYGFVRKGGDAQDQSEEQVGDVVVVSTYSLDRDIIFDHWEAEGLELTEEQKYTDPLVFTMPDNPVSITVESIPYPYVNPFTDVKETDWFYMELMRAYRYHIVNGVTETTFAPQAPCTRAQLVAMVLRPLLIDEPNPEGPVPFTDVDPNAWYYDLVCVAYEMGVITGKSETCFDPNGLVTRAEAVTMIYRTMGMPTPDGEKLPFTDVPEDAYYYKAVYTAYYHDLVEGVTPTRFAPYQICTRAQTMAMMSRLFDMFT